MRISIDCRYIRERPSGIGAYVQALVDRVPLLAPQDQFQFWVDPRAPRPLSRAPNVAESLVRAPANSLRTLAYPSRLIDLRDVDLLHAPFNILGHGIRCASVVTIHDLIWLLVPQQSEGLSLATPFQCLFYRDGIRRALRQASRLIAISQATADSIHYLFPETRPKIRVIHHGIEPHFRPAQDAEKIAQQVAAGLKIEGRYFLVVGQNAPSKNHGAVLRAFAAADLGPAVHLVMLQRLYQNRGRWSLIGPPGLDGLAERLGIAERVIWLSRVAPEQVVELLQGALALIQFSRFEGFGMPALEALACGTPVIASNIAPLLEVLGGAALHVSLEEAALAQAMKQLVAQPSLRQELSARALERSRDFS
jgi:glycosyltransferase involved in cell wall biosynthesis